MCNLINLSQFITVTLVILHYGILFIFKFRITILHSVKKTGAYEFLFKKIIICFLILFLVDLVTLFEKIRINLFSLTKGHKTSQKV